MCIKYIRNYSIAIIAIIIITILPVFKLSVDKKAHAAPPTEEQKIIKAIKRAKPWVVNIRSTGMRSSGSNFVETGSGIIIKTNGFILTNYHVVKGSKNVTVTIYNGKKYHAVVVGSSPREDLAVVRINATGLKVPKWGNSKVLKVGQVAIAIGNPYKFDWTVSRGIISAVKRNIRERGIVYREMIQTDAAINPGSSGGALIDSRGKVIGVNTAVYAGRGGHSAQGLGFAIPIHRALKVVGRLLSKQVLYKPKPWIGISGIDVTPQMADDNMLPVQCGVLITNIYSVSPAKRGGLRKGDIVVIVNDKSVRKVADFKRILNSSSPGQILKLTVWREEKCLTLSIKVTQRSSK
ncbi:MAG: trypsin-like peptidase domain-containing protein [Candidatus Eremiobacteraeota bacterium]|nr:trypsin-like peptidase domain-containing protein [Candidatus Eremiobacteraeota bacterium]